MKSIFFRHKIYISLLALVLPILAFAQKAPPNTPTTLKEAICIFVVLILDFIPYVVVIAVGAFLMGLIKYVANGDNEEKRGEGTKMMIYGIVGFFFMVGIWGIIRLFTSSFGLPFGVPQLAQKQGAYQSFDSDCQGFLSGGD